MAITFSHKYTVETLEDTQALAEKLAGLLKPQDVVTLNGNLGAGKTTFAKHLIQSLVGKEISVTSPTFNLVQIYDAPDFPIWHFDLYRLKQSEEVFELGFEDALASGVSLIEWANLIPEFLPKRRLDVMINCFKEGHRVIEFISNAEWDKR